MFVYFSISFLGSNNGNPFIEHHSGSDKTPGLKKQNMNEKITNMNKYE